VEDQDDHHHELEDEVDDEDLMMKI